MSQSIFRLVKVKDSVAYDSPNPTESHYYFVGKYHSNPVLIQLTHLPNNISTSKDKVVKNGFLNSFSLMTKKRDHLVKQIPIVVDENMYCKNEGAKNFEITADDLDVKKIKKFLNN